MYELNNNVAKIDGLNGRYDEKKVVNPSERYGRNSVDNFYDYSEKPITEDSFKPAPVIIPSTEPQIVDNNIKRAEDYIEENDTYLNALPPLEFEYRYMPNMPKGQIDKEALLGAAYEEMEQRKDIGVDELDFKYTPNSEYTFSGMDINGDKKVDNSEYAASILAADMLGKSSTPDTNNIDGTINAQGMNAVMAYAKKSNIEAAKALYSSIYNKYNLGS